MEGTALLLDEIKRILDAKHIGHVRSLKKEVKLACGSDLLSDVLTFIKPDSLLLTGLTNSQVVRTAEIAEVIVICFVRGKKPLEETVHLAGQKGIPLLTTELSLYEACGRLYKEGLPGFD